MAIARAIVQDAPILVLDEATAHADPENETAIQKALNALAKGRTTVVIAHRLDTIVHADQILVLVGGKVVERGVHEELLAADGHYAALWRSQQVDALEKALLVKERDARRGRGAARSGWRSGAERCRFARKRGTMITTQIDDLVGRPTGVKTQAFLYVLCGLAEAAVYVALLPLLRSLIAGDYVAAGYLVALAAALALLHSVIGFFADNRGYCIGIEQICHALQDALGDHIVRLPLGWFTKERSGQVAALLTKELQMAMDVPSTFLRQMVIAVTTPAAVVVLFLFVDWRIGLVFVIAAPLLLWASRAMAKAAGEGHRQEELSNAEVAARVLEFAHAQPVLRATKRSVEGWDALQQAIERDRAATVATLRTASAPVARYTMLIQVVFAVVFATATALLAWGQIDVASYVFVAVLSLRLVDPLTLIGSQGMALRVAKNALDASEGILKTPPLPETRNPRVPCGSSVAFDRVGFATRNPVRCCKA